MWWHRPFGKENPRCSLLFPLGSYAAWWYMDIAHEVKIQTAWYKSTTLRLYSMLFTNEYCRISRASSSSCIRLHSLLNFLDFPLKASTTSCGLRHEYVNNISRQPPGSLQHRERTSMRRTRRVASSNNFVMIPANIHYYEIQILETILREERRVANKPWFPLWIRRCIAKIDSPSCGIRQASCQDPGPDKL